ncbi:MAG: leucine-rich repeat domain-containing protein, partial [Planctomycetota bacterium]
MTDDTASPMPGTEAKSGRGRKVRLIVAAAVGALVLLVALLPMPGTLLRRRERAAAKHVEALGGLCHWEAEPPSWPFPQLARLLGKRFAKGRERLCDVFLGGPRVADADLAHLKGLTGLQCLSLSNTQVTDAGLVHLKGLTGLVVLDLGNMQVTDAGLVHLKGLTGLVALDLGNTQVTDAGLVHLKSLTGLEGLGIARTQVTDAGVAHLKGLTGLRELKLPGT